MCCAEPLPDEAKATWSVFTLAAATSSAAVFAGNWAFTRTTLGNSAVTATVLKALPCL